MCLFGHAGQPEVPALAQGHLWAKPKAAILNFEKRCVGGQVQAYGRLVDAAVFDYIGQRLLGDAIQSTSHRLRASTLEQPPSLPARRVLRG